MTPEEMVARLLYRDGLMLVIDKPAGFAVHKGPKGGESLEDHFGALRFGLPRAPALAHRLDRDTSGCLVLGRHRKALAELGRLFKAGSVGKTYWALVEGGPTLDGGQHRPAARPQGRNARLVDEARPRRPAGGDDLEGAGPRPGAPLPPAGSATSPGWRWSRSPAAPISCGCTARRWAGRSSATASMERRRASAAPVCICMPAKWRCRCTRIAQPIRVTAPVPLHMHEPLLACGWEGEIFKLVD